MIHIVFQEADVAVLQKAIELDEKLAGPVVQIKDDYAVGPVEKIYEPEGWQQRKAWWQELLQYSPYMESLDMVDDRLTVHNLIKYLNEEPSVFDQPAEEAITAADAGALTEQSVTEPGIVAEPATAAEPEPASVQETAEADTTPAAEKKETPKPSRKKKTAEVVVAPPARELWIWMGQNQHDVCGYYWLMSQLKDLQGKIQVLYLNNLPFINEKGGIFYPSNLYEIQPKEFLKAKRLARTITLSEFEVDPDEWKKLCRENATVRILEGGKKIVSKEADFYDKEILGAVGNEAGKLNKIISTALGKMKIKTGDVFLVWRIRQLVAEGKLEINGDWSKGWKEIIVKPAGLADAAVAATTTENNQ